MPFTYTRKFSWDKWNKYKVPDILRERRDLGFSDGNCGEVSLHYLDLIDGAECIAGTKQQVDQGQYGRSTEEVEKLVSRKTLIQYKFTPYTINSSEFSELCKSKVPLGFETIILLNRPDGAGHYCIIAHLGEELDCKSGETPITEKLDVSRIVVIDPQLDGTLYRNPVNSYSRLNGFVAKEMMQIYFLENLHFQHFVPSKSFRLTIPSESLKPGAKFAYGRKRRGNRSKKQKKKKVSTNSKKVKRKSLPKNKKNKKK